MKHGGFIKGTIEEFEALRTIERSHTSKKRVPYSDEELATIAKYFKKNLKIA